MGFIGEIKIKNLLIGWTFFITMLFIGLKVKNDFFFTVWHTMFVLYFFGQVIYYQFSNGSLKPLIANSIFLIVLFFFSFLKIEFKKIKLKGKLLSIVVCFAIVLFAPIFLKYLPHVNLNALFFEDIYETRLYFREFDDRYFGYLRAPLARVILPSLLVIAIVTRKTWLAILAIFMIVFIYLVGALKSVFIGMLAVILFYPGKRFIDKIYLLLYLFLGLTVFGLVIYLINGNTFLVNSFVRRILFVPPMLDNHYYLIFDQKPLLWSHNILGNMIFDYPLNKPPNMYIGEEILRKKGMSANVGLITEGFFSFNYIGVLVHSFLVGFLVLIMKQINTKPVFYGIVFVYIYYINTSFATVLLVTHGLLFFLLYAYFFLNKDYGKKPTSPLQ